MVTFICEYCDQTLKKKQCERHVRNQCSPGSLICIDCSQTFKGQQYKNHVSCISQQQKHWGQFAKGKKKPKEVEQKVEQKKVEKQEENTEKNSEQKEWRGWKNQIKSLIKQNQNKMLKEDVVKEIRKRYEETVGKDEEIEDQFIEQKIGKLKKVKFLTYVSLD